MRLLFCVLYVAWAASSGVGLCQQQELLAGIKEKGSIEIGGTQFSVFTLTDPNARNKSFNQDGKASKAGNITACDLLVDVPVGNGGGNNSFGGYCTLKNQGRTQKVKICNDELVGHFKVEPAGANMPTSSDLAKFVADNCFGG
jgi:hypothetical protein